MLSSQDNSTASGLDENSPLITPDTNSKTINENLETLHLMKSLPYFSTEEDGTLNPEDLTDMIKIQQIPQIKLFEQFQFDSISLSTLLESDCRFFPLNHEDLGTKQCFNGHHFHKSEERCYVCKRSTATEIDLNSAIELDDDVFYNDDKEAPGLEKFGLTKCDNGHIRHWRFRVCQICTKESDRKKKYAPKKRSSGLGWKFSKASAKKPELTEDCLKGSNSEKPP